MAKNEEIHVDDVGTAIILELCDSGAVLDISSATMIQIILQKVGAKSKTFTASFVTDGTDGEIQYLTQAGDLNVSGDWKAQAYVVLPTGSWRSSVASFTVHENL